MFCVLQPKEAKEKKYRHKQTNKVFANKMKQRLNLTFRSHKLNKIFSADYVFVISPYAAFSVLP